MIGKDDGSSISVIIVALNEEKDVGSTLEELHMVSDDHHLIAREIGL